MNVKPVWGVTVGFLFLILIIEIYQNAPSQQPVSFKEGMTEEMGLTGRDVKSIVQSMLPASLQKLLQTEHKGAENDTIRTTQPCRFAYLDLGSNMGVQIRKLYEPWLYPKAKLLPYYDRLFGKITKGYRREDVCAFGFEANPKHIPRLKYIESAYRKKGLNVTFYHNAVSNRSNDKVTIYSETNFDVDGGAGITNVKIDKAKGMSKFDIETIDIAKFIQDKLLPLNLVKVLMKMDIEGSEFIVLPHLLKNNLLCKTAITEMVIEMHPWAMKSVHSTLTLGEFKKKLASQTCEPTVILGVDDETYNRDVVVDPAWR